MSFASLEIAMGVNETKSLRYRAYFRTFQTNRNTSIMAPPEFREAYFTGVPYVRVGCQILSERIEIDTLTARSETGAIDEPATKWLREVFKVAGSADFVNSAHLSAMEYGRAYLVPTGTDREDGLPGIQAVPGRDMVHSIDPYTGEVLEALRVFGPGRLWRVYYTREATEYMKPEGDGWAVYKRVENPTNRVAAFPLTCRGDVNTPWGRPEGKDVFKLQDAACRVATDMAIASATMAVPQRTLLGAEPEDFAPKNADGSPVLDENGNPLPPPTGAELYMSRMLLVSDPAAKLAEFAAAQLQNFTTALNSITRITAATMGVAQSVFGVASDANPASGDSQREDNTRTIRRSEQLTRGFDPAWTNLFEFLLEAYDFGSGTVSVIWVDPSLPNLSSRADAVLKLATIVVGNRPLYDWEELRQKLGDSQESIDAARERIENDAITALVTQPEPPSE